MMTLEDYLAQDAQRYPEKTAVICGEERLSYAQLWTQVQQRSAGFPRGKVVAFRSSQTVQFLIDYLAIHQAGSVAAPLEKDMPERLFAEVADYLSSCEVPEGSADVLYTTGTTGRFAEVSDYLSSCEVPEGSADVLYTTGTTGHSKGVIISHRTIVADAENLIAGQGFSHDLTFVIHGPLNHIGSLSKIYPVILLGATLHILDGLRDADAFYSAFVTEGKYATFFVPANIRFLLSFDAKRFASLADRLDFIESGGAPLSLSDMQQLCRLLPRTRLYNTYASTETGIIATYNYNESNDGCIAGCLGRPMPHARVIITPEGLIACQGDTLMTGYIGDPELTATVKRDDRLWPYRRSRETPYHGPSERCDQRGRL